MQGNNWSTRSQLMAFSQPSLAATMCMSPCGWPHPLPFLPPFLLKGNLAFKGLMQPEHAVYLAWHIYACTVFKHTLFALPLCLIQMSRPYPLALQTLNYFHLRLVSAYTAPYLHFCPTSGSKTEPKSTSGLSKQTHDEHSIVSTLGCHIPTQGPSSLPCQK